MCYCWYRYLILYYLLVSWGSISSCLHILLCICWSGLSRTSVVYKSSNYYHTVLQHTVAVLHYTPVHIELQKVKSACRCSTHLIWVKCDQTLRFNFRKRTVAWPLTCNLAVSNTKIQKYIWNVEINILVVSTSVMTF